MNAPGKISIKNHPIWVKVNPYKKPIHFLRFFLAKNVAKLYPRSTFIGVTGSVGKTTTKDACQAVLSQKFLTIKSYENLDPIFNIPRTLLNLRPKIKKVVLEMGIEYPGEMDFYLSLVRPATGIITKISHAHSEFLGGPEQIAEEKGKLIKQLPKEGLAILNGDDMYCRKLAKETPSQILFFGMDSQNCDVWASNVRIENTRTKFELNFGVERVEIGWQFLGRHFVYPALAAAALGIANDISLINIKRALETVFPPLHRLQLLEGVGGWSVLDDTYNSSPSALEEALNLANELPARRRILVLGEMRELGVYSEMLHRHIGQKIFNDKFDYVLAGGGDTKFIGNELVELGFPADRLEINLSNSQLVAKILRITGRGDLVLVKGSRAVKLDEVVKRITKQK